MRSLKLAQHDPDLPPLPTSKRPVPKSKPGDTPPAHLERVKNSVSNFDVYESEELIEWSDPNAPGAEDEDLHVASLVVSAEWNDSTYNCIFVYHPEERLYEVRNQELSGPDSYQGPDSDEWFNDYQGYLIQDIITILQKVDPQLVDHEFDDDEFDDDEFDDE